MVYTERKRWPFLGLPWTFTTYEITEELVTVKSGFLRKVENDCYTYKIIDVRLETGLWERLFGLGTIHCFGGDVTNPELIIQHVRNAKAIKDFILRSSEEERLKRKTISTMNISGGPNVSEMARQDSCL